MTYNDYPPGPTPQGPKNLQAQQPSPGFVRSIVMDIILTIVTCGLYNLYIQYLQMGAVNQMLGTTKYEFLPWLFFTIITCGLYHIYHEWRMSNDIISVLGEPQNHLPLIALVVSLLGVPIIADAMQQAEINRYYGNTAL